MSGVSTHQRMSKTTTSASDTLKRRRRNAMHRIAIAAQHRQQCGRRMEQDTTESQDSSRHSPAKELDSHPITGDQGPIPEREERAEIGTSPEQKCSHASAGPLKRHS